MLGSRCQVSQKNWSFAQGDIGMMFRNKKASRLTGLFFYFKTLEVIIQMISPAERLHSFNKYFNFFRINIWSNAVT